NSIMRRYMHVPQIAAVMGQCIAGGAYLPVLSDVILMVKGTSFMGLGGPNLVKGATGQEVDSETLGGAATHTEISGVAHYALDNDEACIAKIRDLIERLPTSTRDLALLPHDTGGEEGNTRTGKPIGAKTRTKSPKATGKSEDLYDVLPADHRMSYDMHSVLRAVLDNGEIDEFQEGIAKEMICGDARFVEAMATARVPKIVLTINHASGAGYYAMAGQGFDPDFILSWPTGRMGVMEGESAVQAVHGPILEASKKTGTAIEAALGK